MPRYGPPPDADQPPPPPEDEKSGLTRWPTRAKILAAVAGVAMITAFVFEFLPPTSSGTKPISTVVTTTTSPLSTTTSVAVSTTTVPTTTTTP